jgi:hypothetical protein
MRATYDEGDVAHALVAPIAEAMGEGGAGELNAALIQHHYFFTGLEDGEDTLTLRALLPGDLPPAGIGEHHLIHRFHAADALQIMLKAVSDMATLTAPHHDQAKAHSTTVVRNSFPCMGQMWPVLCKIAPHATLHP